MKKSIKDLVRLREPESIGGEVDLRINIYCGQSNGIDTKNGVNSGADGINHGVDGINSTEKMPDSAERVPDSTEKMPDSEQKHLVYKYVLENGFVTTNKVMELLNVKQRRARNILQSMVEEEWLRKTGAARSTIYLKNTERR